MSGIKHLRMQESVTKSLYRWESITNLEQFRQKRETPRLDLCKNEVDWSWLLLRMNQTLKMHFCECPQSLQPLG